MTSLPYSSLSSPQLAQAAATFQDDIFGASSADYLYEVAAVTGLLTGQRCPMGEIRPKKHIPKIPPFRFSIEVFLSLSDKAAAFFARYISSLQQFQPRSSMPMLADLPVLGSGPPLTVQALPVI
jgi:hypothetical protein